MRTIVHTGVLVFACLAAAACASLGGEAGSGPRSCPPTVKKTLTYPDQTIRVRYVEPEMQVNGFPLTGLSHTTIYVDLGRGAVEQTKVAASSPSGGKPVERDLTIPLAPGQSVTAYVCVTATNTHGESLVSP